MVLSWDSEAVAKFLGVPAVFRDNSSFLFEFHTSGGSATLEVFPYIGEVRLDIRNGQAAWATWNLDCAEILFNDEISEEGGPCLVFNPYRAAGAEQTHWVVLGLVEGVVEVLTVFRGS
jgi:hypothetical protein